MASKGKLIVEGLKVLSKHASKAGKGRGVVLKKSKVTPGSTLQIKLRDLGHHKKLLKQVNDKVKKGEIHKDLGVQHKKTLIELIERDRHKIKLLREKAIKDRVF